jgi:hypothetical protein
MLGALERNYAVLAGSIGFVLYSSALIARMPFSLPLTILPFLLSTSGISLPETLESVLWEGTAASERRIQSLFSLSSETSKQETIE